MDFEFDVRGLIGSGVSLIFVAMIWKIKTWDSYPFKYKLMLSILLPIICYFITVVQVNK